MTEPTLSRDAVELTARLCVSKALDFWGIPDQWSVHVRVERPSVDGAVGLIDMDVQARQAKIEIHPELESLERVWEVTAHEVAHLALHELEFAERCLWPDDEPTPEVWLQSLERTVWDLTRVFLRFHPYEAQLASAPAAE